MKQLELDEIKKIEFHLLEEFNAFCKSNNIRYFLSNGTLLGAVKYKGFIPWDDDIDVFVPRDDYEKLIRIYADSDHVRLFSYERDKNFRFPFAKLCDMSTIKEENNTNNGVRLGLDIDIFPLDSWGSDMTLAINKMKSISKDMFKLSLIKLKRSDSLNPIKRTLKAIVMRYYKFIGSGYYTRRIQKKAKSDAYAIADYLGCKTWCIYGAREIIPAAVFADSTDVEFEGGMFPAPIGYDVYLRSLYGDYEQDPPAEKQKTHHDYKAYRL